MDAEDSARRYELLKDWLLKNGYIEHIAVTTQESEPFVLGTDFYGTTFEDAVDSLPPAGIN
jgi:hypothetical protein